MKKINVVHIPLLICQWWAIFISVTSINAKQERWKLRHFSSSDRKCNFQMFILHTKVLECEQIALLTGVAWVPIERECVCVCVTSKKRNSVFIDFSGGTPCWDTHISNTLSSPMNSPFFHSISAMLYSFTKEKQKERSVGSAEKRGICTSNMQPNVQSLWWRNLKQGGGGHVPERKAPRCKNTPPQVVQPTRMKGY